MKVLILHFRSAPGRVWERSRRFAAHGKADSAGTDGVSLEAVETRYGVSVLERYGKELDTFMDLGLVKVSSGQMKLTEDGFMVSNEIFQIFL